MQIYVKMINFYQKREENYFPKSNPSILPDACSPYRKVPRSFNISKTINVILFVSIS